MQSKDKVNGSQSGSGVREAMEADEADGRQAGAGGAAEAPA